MADGVAWLVFGDRGILRSTEATVAKLRVRARIPWITIIGIHRMAGRTTARTVISGMIVRSQERYMRIIQACLMEVQHWHADAQPGPQTADTLSDIRLPTEVIEQWVADIGKQWLRSASHHLQRHGRRPPA